MDEIRGRQLVGGLVDVARLTRADGELRATLRTGRLVRLTSRYAVWKDRLDPLATHEVRWLRAVAVGRTMPRAVLSGRSAARAQGMRVVSTSREDVELVLPSGAPPPRRQWPRGCVYLRGAYGQADVVDTGALRYTHSVRTDVDIALRHGFREGLVAMDWLLARGHSHRVLAEIRDMGPVRSISAARAALEHAVPNTRSPWESYARAVLIGAGYRGFRVNAAVGPYEVDLLCGLLIWEVDGDVKYDGVTYAPTGEMLRYEREREKALQNMGYLVRRISPAQLMCDEAEFLRVTGLALARLDHQGDAAA